MDRPQLLTLHPEPPSDPSGRGPAAAEQAGIPGAVVVNLPMQRIADCPDAENAQNTQSDSLPRSELAHPEKSGDPAKNGTKSGAETGDGAEPAAPYDIGICTSQFAAERIVRSEALTRCAGQWLAVGPASAQVLTGGGIAPEIPADAEYSSEGLLKLPQLQQVQGRRIALCKGEGGRELLAQTLLGRGAQVAEFNLYRRERIDYSQRMDTLQATLQKADAVLLSSAESTRLLAQHLERLAMPPAALGPAFALSQRIADIAAGLGFDCAPVRWPPDARSLHEHIGRWVAQRTL